MKAKNSNGILTLFPEGRIDTNNAAQIEKELFDAVNTAEDVKEIILDASELEYISSAGLRVFMKLRKKFGENIRVINVSSEVFDIFDVTGFTELLTVEKRFRELSVDGCEIIGNGMFGTVYRVNEETIVKVYNSPDCLPMIRNEQKLAKKAFIKGVPTAISYDIVKVGDSYGSVFELLNADTFNDIIIRQPERFEEVLKVYANFLKTVHSAEMDPGILPMAKDIFIGYLDVISEYITPEQLEQLKVMICAMPDDLHVVHGDFHMKNVMLVGDEPMLIDMDTLSTGQPIFDLQALYVTYVMFGLDDPNNLRIFLGIPNELGPLIWKKVLENYFVITDVEKFSEINDKIELLASIRFLFILVTTDLKNSELGKKRIRRSQNVISDLIKNVNDFII